MADTGVFLTERRNPRTERIDTASAREIVRMINEEDKLVADAVGAEGDAIAAAIDAIALRLASGGRMIYVGCGTSGRLGVLDASECPPTFSVDPGTVRALIAGGEEAVFRAVEGAEDDADAGADDLRRAGLTPSDVLVGLSASGRAPYVVGAMRYARSVGSFVISVTCSPGSPMDAMADIGIAPDPGPEVIAGSTRMKCGTAQKMVLNMLSTGAMIRLGKVYGNRMVNVKATNSKLMRRSASIVSDVTGADEKAAREALEKCGFRCRTAIVMLSKGVCADEADRLLENSGGRIADALRE